MASSSSSGKKYDVFISFRGTDTRWGFISFLCDALRDKGIKTFIDEDDLVKGDQISPALLEAIEASAIAIIVFSENYAQSRWCLDELNQIVRCMEEDKLLVLPVFYQVEPTDVRNQTGSFGDAFSQHQIRFENDPEKVAKWRESLECAASLSGWDTVARSASMLVKEIVKTVTGKLKELIPSVDYARDLFGIEKNMQKIESLLCIGSEKSDNRVIGIWGMAGIGKTRVARVLCERLSSQFSRSLFLENVREEVKKHQASKLQKRVFSELLNQKDLSHVTAFEKRRLSDANVLLVLDNVDDADQLKTLGIDRDSLSPRGRIVVTSRDLQVLKNIGAKNVYEIKELSFDEAHQLFLSQAFPKEESPAEGYSELAETIVEKYAKRNPLTLTVVGRCLFERSLKEWKSQMELLRSGLPKEVLDVFKVSYDGLSDRERKVFLDIACFFQGRDKNYTQTILGYKYNGVVIGIRVLIDKSLVTINDGSEIRMHDLIQKMGKGIVFQESNDPGEHSRLWSTTDICHVLEENRGTNKIQGVLLKCMSTIEITNSLAICSQIFEKMGSLWFLSIDPFGEEKLMFPEGLSFLPDTLRYFRWDHCPLESLPQSFNPRKLHEVAIHGKLLEQIWNSKYKDLQKLKVLDLSNCCSLNQLPDLSQASNLRSLNLSGCWMLNQLPDLSQASNLTSLNLSNCWSLNHLPDLSSNLTSLNLSGCKRLNKLPDLSQASNLTSLNLSDCWSLNHLPDLSSNLTSLNLSGCQWLNRLPNLSQASNLTSLNLSGCQWLNRLPDLSWASNLTSLNLSGCRSLNQLPDLFQNLNLTSLNLSDCWRLNHLPDLSRASNLTSLSLNGCQSLKQLPDLPLVSNLTSLNLSGCQRLNQLPDLSQASNLTSLNLSGCRSLNQLPDLSQNLNLMSLNLSDCWSLNHLPDLSQASNLRSLNLSGCSNLSELPDLSRNTSLVNVTGIKSLDKLLYLSPYSNLEVRDDSPELQEPESGHGSLSYLRPQELGSQLLLEQINVPRHV